MHTRHRVIPLSRAEAGMVLSDEILDRNGNVLLPAGAVLSEGVIARLPAHEVSALSIVDDAEALPIDRDAAQRRVAHLFRHIDPHDPAQASSRLLRRAVEAYRLDGEQP